MYPIDVENSADIRLITYDDFITLEYEDTVILRFTPGSPAYIQTLEQSGEFIRDSATVNIIDNDRKCEILFFCVSVTGTPTKLLLFGLQAQIISQNIWCTKIILTLSKN